GQPQDGVVHLDQVDRPPGFGQALDLFADRDRHEEQRTEVTGARWSITVDHVCPPSAEPNTSPDSAPKYSPSGVRPSWQNACRRGARGMLCTQRARAPPRASAGM